VQSKKCCKSKKDVQAERRKTNSHKLRPYIIHHHLSAVETGLGKVLNSIILILQSRKDAGMEGTRI